MKMKYDENEMGLDLENVDSQVVVAEREANHRDFSQGLSLCK